MRISLLALWCAVSWGQVGGLSPIGSVGISPTGPLPFRRQNVVVCTGAVGGFNCNLPTPTGPDAINIFTVGDVSGCNYQVLPSGAAASFIFEIDANGVITKGVKAIVPSGTTSIAASSCGGNFVMAVAIDIGNVTSEDAGFHGKATGGPPDAPGATSGMPHSPTAYVCTFVWDSGAGGTFTPPPGYTIISTFGGGHGAVAERDLKTGLSGVQTPRFGTSNTNAVWSQFVVAYN